MCHLDDVRAPHLQIQVTGGELGDAMVAALLRAFVKTPCVPCCQKVSFIFPCLLPQISCCCSCLIETQNANAYVAQNLRPLDNNRKNYY